MTMAEFTIDGLCHLGGNELSLPLEVPFTVFYNGVDVKCGVAAVSRTPAGIHAYGTADLAFISPQLTASQVTGLFPSLAITYRLSDKIVLSVCLSARRRSDLPGYVITERPLC